MTSWPWVRQTLDLSRGARAASATHARTLQNLAAFFDDSGGLGIQPTEVPEIPVGGLEVSKRCRRCGRTLVTRLPVVTSGCEAIWVDRIDHSVIFMVVFKIDDMQDNPAKLPMPCQLGCPSCSLEQH